MLYTFKTEDAYNFARHVNIKAKQSGDELKLHWCPYCKGSNKDKGTFSINIVTGMFKCLRSSCSVSGNMITLSRDFSFHISRDVDEYYLHKTQFKKLKQPENKIIPKPSAIQYMETRCISQSTLELYEITTLTNNDNVLVFPFFDENKRLQIVKYRNINQKGNNNKEWCESNCKPILFGMKQCDDKFDRLIVTEGQMDSLSISECGIKNATSVPFGKNGFTWIPHVWDWWCKFEELIVFGDNENGIITLLEDLKKRFPGVIKVVGNEYYKGCKDANEILCKHGKQAVIDAVNNASIIPVKQVKQLCDVKKRDLKNIPKFKTGIRQIDSMLNGGIHGGQLVIVSGKRGGGKSTFVSQIQSNALEQGKKQFIYSGELPDWQYKSWLDFQIAGPSNIVENIMDDGTPYRFITNSNQELINDWYRDKLYLFDNNITSEDDELVDLISTVEKSVMQYGIDLVVIDNLMTALDVDMTVDEYRAQAKFVKKLVRLAKRLEVAIILIAHPRKNNFSKDENDEVGGVSAITDLADIVLTYKRKPDPECEEDAENRILTMSKNRWFGKLTFGDGITLYYDDKSKRISDCKSDFNKQFSWKIDDTKGFYQIPADLDLPFSL